MRNRCQFFKRLLDMGDRVLFVDDMEVNRLLFENMIEELPVECDCADGAEEAMRLLGENTYKLCLFDHRMPQKDGVELLKELRALEGNPNQHCPCIAMTGDDRPDGEEFYTSLGFDGFLQKPPAKGALLDLVWDHIEAENTQKKELPVLETELLRLPEPIRESSLLSAEDGIQKCGSASAYIDAIGIFLDSLDENAKELEEAFQAKELERYCIKAHGLKSTARLIGANHLAETAASLETACDSGQYDFVAENHKNFLIEYRRHAGLGEVVRAAIAKRSEKSVLLIASQETFSVRSVRTRLMESGIKGVYVQTNAADLKIHYRMANLFLYFTDGEAATRIGFHNYAKKICEETGKKLILVGSKSEFGDVESIIPKTQMYAYIDRPFEMPEMVNVVSGFFRRKKSKAEGRKQILIVDDDVSYMRVMENWLGDYYQVSMASSGIKAMEQLAERPVDLLLLDYEMPVMDGPAFAKLLKNYSNTKNIPVFFLTGKKDRGSVMKAMDVRPVGYVLKTTDRADLLNKIKNYFAAVQAR